MTAVRHPDVSVGTKAQSLADRATESLRLAIVTSELSPEQRIDERLLARRLRIGRTPGREALNRLAAEGLVCIEPPRGAFVSPLQLDQTERLLEAHLVVRRAVAHFCHLDAEDLCRDLVRIADGAQAMQSDSAPRNVCRQHAAFHVRLALAMHNDHLFRFSRSVEAQALRLGCWMTRELKGKPADVAASMNTQAEQRAIVAAVRAADRGSLARALTDSAMLFHSRLLAALRA